jgi:hypothetical protein
MNEPVKVILEGDETLVEAIAARLREMFTITYESKNNQHVRNANDDVRRHLRLLPPGLAHTLHPTPYTLEEK